MRTISIVTAWIVLILLFMMLTHCRKDKYSLPICYDTDVQPILTSKCAYSGCHNSVDKAGGLDLTSHSAFQNYDNKHKILSSINEGRMPKTGSLTAEERKIIARWAARSYDRGVCQSNSGNSCDTSLSITYSNFVKNVFDTHCIGCHNSGTPGGGYSLDTYVGAKNCAQSGRLIGAIQWQTGYSQMPKGAGKLPDCDIAKIQKWINSGMPY